MGRRKGFVFLLLFILLISAGCGMQASNPDEEVEQVTPVIAEEVKRGDLSITNEMVGVVMPDKQMAIIPEAQGKLEQLHVKKGDIVEVGQEIAVIDSSDLSLNLQMEQANLTVTKTQLDAARSRARQAEDAAKNELREGQTSVQTKENLEQAAIAVRQAEANVQQAELRVSQAQKRMRDATVTAPMAGEITSVEVEVGEMVSPQAPLMMITSQKSPKIRAEVSSEQLELFAHTETVQVYVPSLGQELTGKVNYIPHASEQNGLFAVEIEVPDADKLKFGSAAVLKVTELAIKDTLIIPTRAVVERGEDVHVFVVEDGAAVKKPVQLLEVQSDLSAVEGDLSEGDLLIVKGQLTLSDGNKVRLIEEGL